MTALASTRIGRIALHVLCAFEDCEWKFHAAGIAREFAR